MAGFCFSVKSLYWQTWKVCPLEVQRSLVSDTKDIHSLSLVVREVCEVWVESQKSGVNSAWNWRENRGAEYVV